MQTKAGNMACDSDYKPLRMTKRIGATTYKVSVHFSRTSKETIEDKIIKLIESKR